MPLIVSPADAALLIGAKCGGATPDATDPQLLAILSGLTGRLAAAMNVNSLEYDTYTDRFYLEQMPSSRGPRGPVKTSVRLSNGFVDSSSFILYDEDGEVVTGTDVTPMAMQTDAVYGIVDFKCWDRGYYSLVYEAGFGADENSVLTDTPEWMKHVVTLYLVTWYRAIFLQPKSPKDMSHAALMTSLQRELHARVYEKYQRPRAGLVWADAR